MARKRELKYRVVESVAAAMIQSIGFASNPEEDFVPVDSLPSPQTAPLTNLVARVDAEDAGRYTIVSHYSNLSAIQAPRFRYLCSLRGNSRCRPTNDVDLRHGLSISRLLILLDS